MQDPSLLEVYVGKILGADQTHAISQVIKRLGHVSAAHVLHHVEVAVQIEESVITFHLMQLQTNVS